MAHLNDPMDLTDRAVADAANPSAVKRFHKLGFVPYHDGVVRDVILMVREAGGPKINAEKTRRNASLQMSSVEASIKPMMLTFKGSASNDPM